MHPFQPTIRLIDLYGAQNMESLGQMQTTECQSELYLVGVKAPTNGRAPTIWLKHYKNGILTVDDDDDDDEDVFKSKQSAKKV